jgi:maltooligosyltrehalose trehalohydrolase
MARHWTLERGASLLSDNSVSFSVWAPNATHAAVRVASGPAKGDYTLAPASGERGVFVALVPNAGVDADYWFLIDGTPIPDPVSRWQPKGVHQASRVVDPRAFAWSDREWKGIAMQDLIIYELHVGTFTREGTFAAIIPRLPELAELGITAIEIMPVAQFPGERNWGYDGVGLYAVQNNYGGPRELRRLVDAAHRAGIAVILDVVYNHVGPEGNYLDRFGPYFTEKYKTPWGRALNYDDADSDEVRRFIVDNARYWIAEYHIDGLRLDAVHGIFDFSARHLLEEIATAVHEQGAASGRTTFVIAESDLNDPKLLRPVSEHGFGLDAQWSDDFHHAVHAALTGERRGYYSDFGGTEMIAQSLREPFVYAGHFSPHRRRTHGAPSDGIPRSRFVVATQNHDQVGNRAAGERLSTLLEPAKVRLAAALLILSPYVPLIFMGEEYGETNPFQYFVDHSDDDLLEAVRTGRRREFESFGWDDQVPDPGAITTFERSRLEWERQQANPHAGIRRLFVELIEARRVIPELKPDGAPVEVAAADEGWIALCRGSTVTAFNCSGKTVCVPFAGGSGRAWTVRLATDAPAFAETDESAVRLEPNGVMLPPWTAALII